MLRPGVPEVPVADELYQGREDELARFGALLAAAGPPARTAPGPATPDCPAGPLAPRVIVVQGPGGAGKTWLLRRFKAMADGDQQSSPLSCGQSRTVWLDWEDERRRQPYRYAEPSGPCLLTLLSALADAVASATGSAARPADPAGAAFGRFESGAALLTLYAERIGDVVARQLRGRSPFSAHDTRILLTSAASASLVLGGPARLPGLAPAEFCAPVTAEDRGLSEAAIRAVTAQDPARVAADDSELLVAPVPELIRRMAAGLRAIADCAPLVIFMDQGEIIGGRGWEWLCRLTAETGPGVIWVISGRFPDETETGADSVVARFVRDNALGLAVMAPAPFGDSAIREYMTREASGRRYTDEQISLISRFTGGLPLAVSMTEELLRHGQQVGDVCGRAGAERPAEAVRGLARRYLAHAEHCRCAPGDRLAVDLMPLIGLALAPVNLRQDAELAKVLCGVPEPRALEEVASRHPFVMGGAARLQEDVGAAMRAAMLEPARRDRIRALNHRAVELLDARLAEMRTRWPSVDEQLAQPGFGATLLARLWHALWLDNDAGLDMFFRILPVLAVADVAVAHAAAALVDPFTDSFTQEQLRRLTLVTAAPVPSDFGDRLAIGSAARERRDRRVDLASPMLGQWRAGTAGDPGIGDAADSECAQLVLQAVFLARGRADDQAIAALRQAASLTTSTRLRQVIGSEAEAISDRLNRRGPDRSAAWNTAGLAAAELATEMLQDLAVSPWQTYAAALDHAGRHTEALAAYDRALALDPRDPAARGGRGDALRALGRYEDALAAYDQALSLDPDDTAVQFSRASVLRVVGSPSREQAPRDQVPSPSTGVEALLTGGLALLGAGAPVDALAAFDRALALDSENAESHACRGLALHAAARYADALAAFDQALSLAPGEAVTHANRGAALHALGRYTDALAALDQALSLEPAAVATHVYRGAVLHSLGRYQDAIASYDQALVREDADAEAQMCRAAALQALGRFEEALAGYDRALALDPGNLDAHLNRGTTLRALGRLAEALAAFDEVLALDPDDAEARSGLGAALSGLGRFAEALAAFDEVLAVDPDDAEARSGRGAALYSLGRFAEALAAFEQVAVLQPDDASVHARRGDALRAAGRFEDAVTAYDRALRQAPDYTDAYSGRGVALHALSRFQDALAAYDRALMSRPGDAVVQLNRGAALFALGRFEDALAAYDRAFNLDPDNAAAEFNRGAGLQALGRLPEALVAYDKALLADPDDADARTGKGIVLALTGALDEALAELDASARLVPDGAGEASAWAGAILWHQRNVVGARQRFARVEGSVVGCTPLRTAELEGIARCALGRADSAALLLLAAVPQRTACDLPEPRGIYALLSDPPLPGIERLRAIASG